MELRKSIRIKLPEIEERRSGEDRMSCSFDFDQNLSGTVTDLSPGGFGIEIHGINGSQAEIIKGLDYFTITISLDGGSLIAGVKNAWHRVVFDRGSMYIKCGVAIDVISPADRLKLTEIIEKIRNGQ